MAIVHPKEQDFGARTDITDFSKGMHSVKPSELLLPGQSPRTKNVFFDERYLLHEIFGTTEFLTISANDYNRHIRTPIYSFFDFVMPGGQSVLIIQGNANSSHASYGDSNMSLFKLDKQSSYPASVDMTRILGEDDELTSHHRICYTVHKGCMYIANGADPLMRYNGATWKTYHSDYPERFKYVTSFNRRLWMANSGRNPSRLIFSEVNYCHLQHYYCTEGGTSEFCFDFMGDDGSPIMWICTYGSSLLIFKQHTIYQIIGDPSYNPNFNIIEHSYGTINGWTVQVHRDLVYYMAEDGIRVLGKNPVRANVETGVLEAREESIKLTGCIQDWWDNYITLPEPSDVNQITHSTYEDWCSTLAYVSGGDATNFKADGIFLEPGDVITGGTSGAMAEVVAAPDPTSGAYADGDAVGTLYLTNVWEKLAFTSGGTTGIKVDQVIVGATSGSTALVRKITITSGSWAGGNAAGNLYIENQSAAFQSENLNVQNVADNQATITADSAGWANSEAIKLGTKQYATAASSSAFTEKYITEYCRVNRPSVNTSYRDVINFDFWKLDNYNDRVIESAVSQISTTTTGWVTLRSTSGKGAYFAQGFKLDAYSDKPIAHTLLMRFKETGDVSGDTVKVLITDETDSNPDFDNSYAEGTISGNFLHGLETLGFDAGTSEIYIGETVVGAGAAEGVVHKVIVTSGTWAGSDAAGTLYLKSVTGTFVDDEALSIGGTQHATCAGGDATAIADGIYVPVVFDYWDNPQNLYDGSGAPQCYIGVKVTGDDDSNYLSWSYTGSNPYADGQMKNSDGSQVGGVEQSTLDYHFHLYNNWFHDKGTIITPTITATSGYEWKEVFIKLDTNTLGGYTRNSDLEEIYYMLGNNGSFSGGTWVETTNGGYVDGSVAFNDCVKFKMIFYRSTGHAYHNDDSFTIVSARVSYYTQDEFEQLVDSAIFDDRYIVSVYRIEDPEVIAGD